MNRHVTFALLALAPGLMLFVCAWRIAGQPLPPQTVVTNPIPEPDTYRTVTWTRDTNAVLYTLMVNRDVYDVLARGTNGSTMTMTNVGFIYGENMLALAAHNATGTSSNATLRYGITNISESYTVIMFSPNCITGWVITNAPPNGKYKNPKTGNGCFKPMPFPTNYFVEGPL